MADRNVTVLNPAGYQEQLPDTDNIVLTLAPTQDYHGVNKKYVVDYVQTIIDNATGGGGAIDSRYVNVTGDTMTGDLTIQNSELTVGGDITIQNAALNVGDAKLSLTAGANEYHIGTKPFRISSDAGLNLFKVHDSSGNVAIGGDVSVPGDKLQVNGNTSITGKLTVDNDLTVNGDISGVNGDFTGDVSLANITVDQINLRSSNAGADGFINTQNFNVDEPSLTITNTGPLSLVGTPVDITGVTTVATSLRVGNFSDYVYFIGGTGEISGELTVKGDAEVGNFATQGIKLVKDGYIDCNRQAANHSIYRGKLNGTVNIDLHANGDATFNGDLVAATLTGDIDQGEY